MYVCVQVMLSRGLYNCVYAFTDNDIYKVGCLQVVKTLLSCLDDPQLPHLQWQECMAVLATRLPKDMRAQVLSTTQCCPLHSKEWGAFQFILLTLLDPNLRPCDLVV